MSNGQAGKAVKRQEQWAGRARQQQYRHGMFSMPKQQVCKVLYRHGMAGCMAAAGMGWGIQERRHAISMYTYTGSIVQGIIWGRWCKIQGMEESRQA